MSRRDRLKRVLFGQKGLEKLEGRRKYEKMLRYIRRQADRGSEMHQYMLQRYNQYINQGVDFNTAVRKARQGGILHFASQKMREAQTEMMEAQQRGDVPGMQRAEAKYERYKRQVRGHALTRTQTGQEIEYYKHYEPPLSKLPYSAKRVKNLLYEFLILALLGLSCIFVPPFFGLPSFQWLGYAFFVSIPYAALPNEREALKKRREEGEDVESISDLASADLGQLFTKSILKTFVYGLIIFQFWMYNRLISLIVSFFLYFSLKTRYKSNKIYKAFEAWLKMGLGAWIAYLFSLTFGGVVGPSLALMGAAFFLNFPVREAAEDRGGITIKIGKRFETLHTSLFDKLFFGILMLASFFSSGYWLQILSLSGGMIEMTFGVVWIISFIAGLSAGPEGRPAIGAMMIIVALFAFSSTYTGQVGSAIFGYWWPQVQSGMEMISEPLGEVWYQAQQSMSDAWMLMTNPAQYYNLQMMKQQATQSRVKSGGTVKSIELTKFDLFTSLTGFLEPREDPLIGSIEIQNQGEFYAKRIVLRVSATWKNSVTEEEFSVGELDDTKFECSSPARPPVITGGTGTCDWDGRFAKERITYPDEIRLCTFVFNKGTWEVLDNCITYEEDPITGEETVKTPVDCDFTDEAVYEYANEVVKVNVTYTYDYSVNVSIPVEVIDSDVYRRLLEAREIILEEITSQYTGGPAKATIWSQRQPIRIGDMSLFVASVYNEGRGNITKVESFKIKIPTDLVDRNDIEYIGSTFYRGRNDDGCLEGGVPNITTEDGYYVLTCEHTWYNHQMGPGEYKRVSFFITPKDIKPVDRITSLIIGLVSYEYEKTKSESLTIVNNPLQ